MAAQPVVLKALAKLAYDLNFSNRAPENALQLYEQLLDRLHTVDFSHKNKVWNYYSLTVEAREAEGLAGLAEYLPPDDGANRDVGSEQSGLIRFGAKHNDIYPLLADMIRWQTGLPSRHS